MMILIVAAMVSEVESIIPSLTQTEKDPFMTYEGKISTHQVCLIVTGIGKVNAAAGLTYMLGKQTFNQIINVGLAGGYLLNKGESVLVARSTYHDFDLTFFDYEKGQVPHYPTWFEPNYLDLNYKEFKQTPLYTGDYFSTSVIAQTPYVADMEGNAFFQVAHRFNIPLASLKVVSDVIGSTEQLETYQASEMSFQDKLRDALLKLLN